MIQRLLCRNPLTRVVSQHLFQQLNQVHPVLRHLERQVQILLLKIIKSVQDRTLVWNSLIKVSLVRFRHPSQPCCNLEKLIPFRLALEKRRQSVQLRQNAPSRPNINRCWVLGEAKDEFWSSVVSGNNVRCVFPLWIDNLAASEITNFDFALLWKQNIFWFEVSMGDAILVDVLESVQKLVRVFLIYFDKLPWSDFPWW